MVEYVSSDSNIRRVVSRLLIGPAAPCDFNSGSGHIFDRIVLEQDIVEMPQIGRTGCYDRKAYAARAFVDYRVMQSRIAVDVMNVTVLHVKMIKRASVLVNSEMDTDILA